MPPSPESTEDSESTGESKGTRRSRDGRRAWEQRRQEQTRFSLVEAATTVFVRDGFAATTIAGITEEAGVSTGSFYNYFRTKEDILRAVVERIHASFYGGTPSALDATSTLEMGRRYGVHTYDELFERLQQCLRTFLKNYRKHASFLQLLDEIPKVDHQLNEIGRLLRWRIVDSNVRFIETLQKGGLADPGLNAFHAASALGAMMDRFAYLWFVLGEPFDEATSIDLLTTFWLRSLGVAPKTEERSDAEQDGDSGSRQMSDDLVD
jgi:AcrR family transcriptional regulator